MLLIYIGAACTHQCSNTQSAASHHSSSTHRQWPSAAT